MKNIYLIITLSFVIQFVTFGKEKPNLIIIHTDEQSFRTLSCYQNIMSEDQAFVWGKGNNVNTPNIDRLADEGAICANYYCASPVCTPSRASLVTGLYPQATGAPKNGKYLRDDIPTFASILLDQGYATSYVGKWHLAGHSKYTFDVEYNGGFADNRYMMRGGHAPYFYMAEDGLRGVSDKVAAKQPKDKIVHLTDYFTDKSLEILERDKDKPFCLMLSIPDPHTPDYARPPYHSMYDDMDVQAPKTMSPKYTAKKPQWAKGNEKDKNEAKGFDADALRQYFGMVKHIDDNVGRILDFLDTNKLSENTIVIFTSDHGDMFYEHNRRNKGVPYEASARIPYVIRYPAKIVEGKIIRKAYTNVDFTPTILALMDIKTTAKFHGEDTSEDFSSSTKEINDDRIVYYAKSGGWWVAAVNNRYKLVVDKNEKPYLFDLVKDPDELVNYFETKGYEDISKKLMDELFVQMKKYDEPGLKTPKAYKLK